MPLHRAHRIIARALIVSLTAAALVAPAQAAMLSTESALAGRQQELARSLERSDVRAALEAYGVAPADAKARVLALSDDEAARLASAMDKLPAGGDGGIGAIIGAAVFVFVILLITDILGLTKVFPFTKPVR